MAQTGATAWRGFPAGGGRFDWLAFALAAVLGLAGVLVIARGGGGATAAFGLRQALFLAGGLALLGGLQFVPYRAFARASGLIYLAGLALLGLLAVCHFGASSRGDLWIPLGFVNLQPSELMKLALVLYLAENLRHRTDLAGLRRLFWPVAAAALPAGLVLLQPDLGTALTFGPILLVLLFVRGARLRDLAVLVALALALLPVAWFGLLKDYQKNRIISFIDPAYDPQGSGYQVLLAVGSLGSGELTGVGLGQGSAALPDRHTDFIFALLGQELGFCGAAGVLLAYFLLLWRLLGIAQRARDPGGRLIAAGVAAIIAAQVFINVGMAVRLMPVTGLPLPLISYGGSSLLTVLTGLGLALNVGRRSEFVFTLQASEGAEPVVDRAAFRV